MFKWFNGFSRGQRASDRQGPAPAVPKRDRTLEAVIAHQRIAVLFQPQIDPVSGNIVGAEALARWDGAASPEALFARAAQAGLAERLSRMIQRKALQIAATWEGALKPLHLSINLLPQDLARPGYERWLLDEIESAGIDPKRITVEITESALLADSDAIGKRLAVLRAAGVRIAVDDFGTGYASLSQLRTLPFDRLKIDRTFVNELAGEGMDSDLVEAIVSLGRGLSLPVTAEGVETAAILEALRGMGQLKGQGYLYGKAQDAAATRARLADLKLLAEAEATPGETPAHRKAG